MSKREQGEPSLGVLSFILRHKELWPEGFRWSYASCEHCALGLAKTVWPEQIKEASTDEIVRAFGIDPPAANSIFMELGRYIGSNALVSPENVADRIDQLLETV